jgi:UDP-N-acetylmuramyl pentapeptide phosphotransferase/UDP-N-acetylglucosamine-1-phosphate transferase
LGIFSLKRLSQNNWLRKQLYLSSEKSSSKAILLGGIPLYLSLVLSILVAHKIMPELFDPNQTQSTIVYCSLIAGSILFVYGYLDDRFEIRPWVKLACQIVAVSTFTLSTSGFLTDTHYSNIFFLGQTVIGLALLNGVNLLDGIDGITAKASGVILASFLAVSIIAGNPMVFTLSLIMLGALLAFYSFNRQPARIYMGEAGTTILGLFFLTLSTLIFEGNNGTTQIVDNFALCVFPLMHPLVEVTVSFVRRLMNGKSPFRGDRFHLHHILCDFKGHSHEFSASVIAGISSLLIAFAMSASFVFNWVNPLVSLSFYCASIITIYFAYGKEFWFKEELEQTDPFYNAFQTINKKEISLIDLDQINQFEVNLNQELIEKLKEQQYPRAS